MVYGYDKYHYHKQLLSSKRRLPRENWAVLKRSYSNSGFSDRKNGKQQYVADDSHLVYIEGLQHRNFTLT